MAGLAGMLFLSVPGLSWMLVSGSGVMLGNIAGIIGGSFTKNISPDAVMQDATQLEAAKQASIQMDKRVGVAEMAEFAARRQAATEGGMYAGARKAMMQGGFGMSEFGRMAEVQSASEVGQAAAFANQVGNGTNAARAGAIQGAQAGAQTMATANTIGSTSNAAMIGTITGTQAASAALAHAKKIGSTEEAARVGRVEGSAKAGGEIGQANAYGGSVDAAFDTNRKAALGSELQKRKHFQQLSDDQVATNAAHRGFLSGQTDANLADKLSSDPSMYQKEMYQAEVNANKEVSQFDSADTAAHGLTKKKGISLNDARNAIATVARNSAATQIAGEAATALGEKNVIGGSLASAMMANSVEMGLWGGTQSGANANILQSKSMASEKIVAEHEANVRGVGAVFGEYDNWQKNLNKQKKEKAFLENAKKAATVAKNEELSDTTQHLTSEAKNNIANDIEHIKNAKSDSKRKKWQEKLSDDVNDLKQLQDASLEYQNSKVSNIAGDIPITKQDVDNLNSSDWRKAQSAEHKIAELKQKYGDAEVDSVIQQIRTIDNPNAIKQKYAQGLNEVNQGISRTNENIYKLNHTYDPSSAGAVRLSQTIGTAAIGSVIRQGGMNALNSYDANAQLRASSDIASGNVINSAVSRGISISDMANAQAARSVGGTVAFAQSANEMSSSGFFNRIFNRANDGSQSSLLAMGFGSNAAMSLAALNGMNNFDLKTTLDGYNGHLSYDPQSQDYVSDFWSSEVGMRKRAVYKADTVGNVAHHFMKDMSINSTEILTESYSAVSDTLSLAGKAIGGKGGFSVFKSLNKYGWNKNATLKVDDVLAGKNSFGESLSKAGGSYDTTLISKVQTMGN